jgi:phage antirepressor YoqD-like protein
MQGWAKIKEAAKFADIGERTMREWLKQGLKHSRLSTGTILIRYSDIDDWLESFAVNEDQINQMVDEVCRDLHPSENTGKFN